MLRIFVIVLLAWAGPGYGGQPEYGAKGIFPVYEIAGDWLIFDKNPQAGKKMLARGQSFLVIGSLGAGLFGVLRSSAAAGGTCSGGRPARLKTIFLSGMRSSVGSPIIAIHVPRRFKLKGSRAKYLTLANQVSEDFYQAWNSALKENTLAEMRSGPHPNLKPEEIALKIDFASPIRVRDLPNAFALIEGAQVKHGYRRCLRLVDGDRLVGDCVVLPHELMAETALLQFVAYDPGGAGTPYLLAYTASEPLWGHERWGFVITNRGARLFLKDAMDPRCREGF